MKKENEIEKDEIWFKELLLKVETYDHMYYTINKYNNEEIIAIKKEYEEREKCIYSYEEIIDMLIHQDLCGLVSLDIGLTPMIGVTNEGLIYLPIEKKVINRREIKESFIQFN